LQTTTDPYDPDRGGDDRLFEGDDAGEDKGISRTAAEGHCGIASITGKRSIRVGSLIQIKKVYDPYFQG
jgi:hypothetical protein